MIAPRIAPSVRPRRNDEVVRSSSGPLMCDARTGRGSPPPTRSRSRSRPRPRPPAGGSRRSVRRSQPSRSASASPAHAPRIDATMMSGSRPPALPRMSTYSDAWKMPTRTAKMSAGSRLTRHRRATPTPRRRAPGPRRRRGRCRRRDRRERGPRDPSAAEHDVAVVQDRGLTGRGGPDRAVELGDPAAAAGRLRRGRRADRGRDRRGAVPDPDRGTERRTAAWRVAGDEGHPLEVDRRRLEVLATTERDRVGQRIDRD